MRFCTIGLVDMVYDRFGSLVLESFRSVVYFLARDGLLGVRFGEFEFRLVILKLCIYVCGLFFARRLGTWLWSEVARDVVARTSLRVKGCASLVYGDTRRSHEFRNDPEGTRRARGIVSDGIFRI